MSDYYAITATLSTTRTGWNSVRQIPTFYLSRNVQGIVSEHHAQQIARDILDPFSDHGNRLTITAVAL